MKKLFLPLLAVALFLSAHVSRTDAITCSPPSIVTGCTEIIAGTGVLITATVPVPSGTVAPTVVTDSAISVTTTTATLNGLITDTGGASATVVGFSYGTTTTYDTTTLNSGLFDVGPFSASITGLACGTTYHYRAYATNPVGTGVGADMTFVTDDCPIIPIIIDSGGGHGIPSESTVNFIGTAYPGAHVVILADGNVMVATTAGPDGHFVATVGAVAPGLYVFSAYAQDVLGRVSASYSFPFSITVRSIVTINNILIPPTITLDRYSVSAGNPVTVSGAAAPNSVVHIVLASSTQHTYSTLATGLGTYSFALGTAGLADPAYAVRSSMLYQGQESPSSRSLVFRILGALIPLDTTDTTIPHVGGYCGIGQGDLNCDGHVNIIDFTIMKSWYHKPNPPAIVDLSGDGQITLKDFSILTSDWTG